MKKKLIIIAILIMSIGFAIVSTNLIINGTSTIGKTTFDVYFSGAEVDGYDKTNEVGRMQYGTVKFSDNRGWTEIENNLEQTYDGPVKKALYGSDGNSGYQAYIRRVITGARIRLIQKSEVETLVNNGNALETGRIKDKADAKGASFLYNTSYWTGSAVNIYRVWYINVYNYFGNDANYDLATYFGVRPVVEFTE